MYPSVMGNLSLWSVIQTRVTLAKSDTMNKEYNKL